MGFGLVTSACDFLKFDRRITRLISLSQDAAEYRVMSTLEDRSAYAKGLASMPMRNSLNRALVGWFLAHNWAISLATSVSRAGPNDSSTTAPRSQSHV